MKKRISKFFAVLLAATLMLFALPNMAYGAEYETDGLVYEIKGGGLIVVNCTDTSAEKIVIPEKATLSTGMTFKVVGINDYAFGYCDNLSVVNVPSTLKAAQVGDNAFLTAKQIVNGGLGEAATAKDVVKYFATQINYLDGAYTDEDIEEITINFMGFLNKIDTSVSSTLDGKIITFVKNADQMGLSDDELAKFKTWIASIEYNNLTLKGAADTEIQQYAASKEAAGIKYDVSYTYPLKNAGCELYYIPLDTDEDGEIDSISITGYTGNIQTVTVPNKINHNGLNYPVISIGPYAFADAVMLNTVYLPKTITNIGEKALGFFSDGTLIPGFTIYGYADTFAERYAKRDGVAFMDMNSIPALSMTDIEIDQGQMMGVTIDNYTGTATWVSSDTTIATVADGYITGISGGTATIYAFVGETRLECNVTVKAVSTTTTTVISPVLSQNKLDMEAGQIIGLQVENYTGKITWVSSDTTIATVADGYVSAVGGGTATIYAFAGSTILECTVKVKAVSTTTTATSATTTTSISKTTTTKVTAPTTTTTSASTTKKITTSKITTSTTVTSITRKPVISTTTTTKISSNTSTTSSTSTSTTSKTITSTSKTTTITTSTTYKTTTSTTPTTTVTTTTSTTTSATTITTTSMTTTTTITPTLSLIKLEMEVGQTIGLQVNNYTGDIKWISDDTTVATVTDGYVSAVGNGTATIYVFVGDTILECTIKVKAVSTSATTPTTTTSTSTTTTTTTTTTSTTSKATTSATTTTTTTTLTTSKTTTSTTTTTTTTSKTTTSTSTTTTTTTSKTTTSTTTTTTTTTTVHTTIITTTTTPTVETKPFETKVKYLGDANDDDVVNVRDAACIAKLLAIGQNYNLPETADINQDGIVNVRDAATLARKLASGNKQWVQIIIKVYPIK